MLEKNSIRDARFGLLVIAALGFPACARNETENVKARAAAVTATSGPSFTEFESGQVRPLALSPSGRLLFAVNTPDNRLEIFRVLPIGLQHVSSVTVGLEPVAVAAPSETEVWVVNHLSDSVSIVSLARGPLLPAVVRTLLVGDEPRDIVFAGPGGRRAFITTAHRGQNIGFDPQLTTASVGRADVWAFDADNLGAGLGGTPLTVLTLFTDTPRALAVTADGSRVYAAGFHTGNQTTSINFFAFPPQRKPGPFTNYAGVLAPPTGLIVKFNGVHWVDETGGTWDDLVEFSLPDRDVFAIDATASPPQQITGAGSAFAHVGTILFNMAVNPVSGKVYVSNLESFNQVRFEGPGTFTGRPTVRGHNAENRISVLDPGAGTVTPRHLNKHIDFSTCCAAVPNDENAKSLAFPTGMAISSDGATLYVTALGSSKVGIYSTAQLETDTFTPSTANQVTLTGGGPTGVVLDEPNGRLYVLTRFDNSISTVDTTLHSEVDHVALYNPEPPSITIGRRFLYDASFTSSHGDAACATCHIFGDFDSLAWDLGNPDNDPLNNPGPSDNDLTQIAGFYPGMTTAFHPMKGPMTTQSLRGMANHGPMHWRGDRTGGNDEPTAQPNSGTFDTHLAFEKFNVAFGGLVGRDGPIAPDQMSAYADFILQVSYPPNPIRNLDDSDTPDQAAARAFFMNTPNSVFLSPATRCNDCHKLDPNSNRQFGVPFPGSFGSDGQYAFILEPEIFKNPHLRNQYQKVGMFGNPPNPALLPGNNAYQGDQVRGFGFFHDGSIDTDFRFVSTIFFSLIPGLNDIGIPPNAQGDVVRRQLEQFMLAFPSNLKPIVGQQITLSATTPASVAARIDLLEQRAAAGDCDLVAKTEQAGRERGFLYTSGSIATEGPGSGSFIPDQQSVAPLSDASLRVLATLPGGSVTFTCVPPGSGVRIGIDRDLDGILDGDEPQ
jgi:DNA-binding beta-propeller fold protein YncE